MIHERIDIGLASVSQILAGGGPDNPLKDFLPSWWDWMFEPSDGSDTYDDGQPNEADQMITTMRALAAGWKTRKKEVDDGPGSGGGAGGSDHGRRYLDQGGDGASPGGDG